MRALVAGATGFIGTNLLARLDRPVVLSRHPQQASKQLEQFGAKVYAWDAATGRPPAAAFDGIDVVFNLAGESVGEGRWNEAKKQRIRESRVNGTRHLVETLAELPARPRALVSASAIGYYGSRGDDLLDESAAPGHDFLAEVCAAWEREAGFAEQLGMRVVMLRTGIVLGKGGGALKKMLTPFKLGIGGRLGSGSQWMSWIHLDDEVSLMLHAAQHESVRGPINLVSPEPVTNLEFTRDLGRALGRPTVFPMPAFALNLAVGEFAEVLLGSQRVIPKVAKQTGYEFRYPSLPAALEQLTSGRK